MRELIFRGKTKHNGKWVISDSMIHLPIVGSVELYDEVTRDWVDVIPETVGQFTGLTDKHGVNIFEGDIVDVKRDGFGSDTAIITYERNGFYAKSQSYWGTYDLSGGEKADFGMGASGYVTIEIEIIGNKYDNGDLL